MSASSRIPRYRGSFAAIASAIWLAWSMVWGEQTLTSKTRWDTALSTCWQVTSFTAPAGSRSSEIFGGSPLTSRNVQWNSLPLPVASFQDAREV
uniref:Uncharacterized protein n=1 Tax=Mycobacterium riyadhense TaxID=486698 RepID=A0A653F0F1_9MYCO|nr:hypothetical protein BIN_B_04853 [Mycobacterium riyadhense]